MKKTNKKQIPKVRLPKYSPGGSHNFNESMYDSSQSTSTQGTQDAYNEKRSKGLNAGQYAQAGLDVANVGMQMQANQGLDGEVKNQRNAQAIGGGIDSIASSATPWYALAKGASNMGKGFTKQQTVVDPTTGKSFSQSSNRTNQAFADTFTPMHETAIKDFSEGNAGRGTLDILTGGVYNTMDNYLKGTNKKQFEAAKANEAAYNQQQQDLANQQNAAAQEQQNAYIQNAVQQGIAANNQGGGGSTLQYGKYGGLMKFAMGGMQYANGGTGEINAEVEGGGYNQDGENAVAPNGEFTQFNGPTHAQGGIQTDMAPGTRIFSDKLKAPGSNKTFAKLNASNNTNREDKLETKENLDPKSKTSIDLTRMAKMKNSDMLFAMQEQLKKDKVAAYAKKMGIQLPSMDNESMEQGQSEQSEGEYKYGGIHINPANKGKFTASAQRAGMGTQEFASHVLANKEDYSSTQVKRANFAHNAAGWKHEMGGMQPYAMGGESEYGGPNDPKPFNVKDPIVKAAIARNLTENPLVRDYSYELKTGGKKGDELFATDSSGKKTKINFQDLNTGEYNPAYNDTVRAAIKIKIKDSLQKHALGGVQLPYYNTDRNGNPKYAMGGFNDGEPLNEQGLTKPQYQQAQTDSMTLYKSGLGKKENWNYSGFNDAQLRLTNPKTGETPKSLSGKEVTSTGAINNFSGVQQYQKPSMTPWKEYIPEVPKAGVSILNKTKNDSFHPVYDQYIPGIEKSKQKGIVLQYSNGGKMPKYVLGGEEDGDNELGYTPKNSAEAYRMQQAAKMNALANKKYSQKSPYDNIDAADRKAEREAREAAEIAGTGATLPTEDKTSYDWKGMAGNIANFAAQNAGNIYDLTRKNEPLQKYERAKASYLDNTAAMRDAEQEARRDEYAVRGASGGNAGTYLANRVGLNTAKVMNKDRIRQQYANANAQIGNQNAQFNAEIAYREAEARAKDAAMKENVRSQAIASLGSSFGKATKSGKQDNIDQDTLKMFQWRYKNEPGFKKYIDNFSTEKDSKEAVA